jgi:hypothetical protein
MVWWGCCEEGEENDFKVIALFAWHEEEKEFF